MEYGSQIGCKECDRKPGEKKEVGRRIRRERRTKYNGTKYNGENVELMIA